MNPSSASPRRAAPRLLVVAAALLALGPPAALAAAGPVAPAVRSTKNCSPPKYPGSGYFTSLRVTRVSCSTGKRITLAHYHCRVRHGARGRCDARVRGYRCKESKRQAIATEIDAAVTCTRGAKRVVYTYQQNL